MATLNNSVDHHEKHIEGEIGDLKNKNSVCGVCLNGTAIYKCPVCVTKYCSVECYKKHKGSDSCTPISKLNDESPSQPVHSPENGIAAEYNYESEDTVPLEKLKFLETNKKVLEALQNPHLRKMLQYLDSSHTPSHDIASAMREPIFVEFASHCLDVVTRDHFYESSDSSDDS